MVYLNLQCIGHKGKINLDDSVKAAFVTGSFVNGYFRDDSDIDIVIVSDIPTEIRTDDPKISFHYLSSTILDHFEIARYYCILRNVPLLNEEYVSNVSSRTKREMVMKEAKKLQKGTPRDEPVMFEPMDIVFRHLTWHWGVLEVSRIKPLQRIRSSPLSHRLLEEEYLPIFEDLLEKRFLGKEGEKYYLSPSAVINDDKASISRPLSKLAFYVKESRGGWLYLKNLTEIYRNIQRLR